MPQAVDIPATTPQSAPQMFQDRAILLLALGQTLIWAGMFYVFPASLLLWEQDLGWSRSDLTLAITMAILASGFAAPLAGALIDRGKGSTMMGVGAALGGLSLIALSQVTQLWQFYLIWIGIGVLMSGTLYEATFAMLTRSRGAAAKPGIVQITLIAGFAGSLSFPIVNLLGQAMGWRAALMVIGLFIGCVVAPMLWTGARMLGAPAAAPPQEAETPIERNWMHSPVFWLLGIGFALSAIVHGATLHHLLPMLEERALPGEFAILIASLIGPMQVVGRVVMVLIGNRMSHHGFALLAFGGMIASILILYVSGTERALVLAFVLLFGSAYGTVSILRPLIARDLLGEENFGAKSGGLAAMYMGAAALSAWLGALIWARGGYDVMLGVLIVLGVLGGTLYLSAHQIAQRR